MLINNIKRFYWFLIIFPVLIVSVYFGLDLFVNNIGNKFNDGLDTLINKIEGHLFGLTIEYGRATYIETGRICRLYELDQSACSLSGHNDYQIGDLKGLIVFIPVSLFNYLFQPFPWRITEYPDLILFLENIFRGTFILVAFINLFFRRGLESRLFLLLFCSFIILETIWAIGSANWGQASRHHIPGLGLLVIIAFRAKLLNVKTV